MYRFNYFVFIALVFISFYYIFTGLWKLLRYRKYKELILSLILIAGGLILIDLLISIGSVQSSDNQKFWFYVPAVVLLFIWLFSGFLVRGYVIIILNPLSIQTKQQNLKNVLIVKVIGWISLIISLSFWVYGIYKPLNERLFIWGTLFRFIQNRTTHDIS